MDCTVPFETSLHFTNALSLTRSFHQYISTLNSHPGKEFIPEDANLVHHHFLPLPALKCPALEEFMKKDNLFKRSGGSDDFSFPHHGHPFHEEPKCETLKNYLHTSPNVNDSCQPNSVNGSSLFCIGANPTQTSSSQTWKKICSPVHRIRFNVCTFPSTNSSSTDKLDMETQCTFKCCWENCPLSFSTRTGLATHVSTHLEDYIAPFWSHFDPTDEIAPKKSKSLMVCRWNGCMQYFYNLRQLAKHLAQDSHVGQTPFLPKKECKNETLSRKRKSKRYLCSVEGCDKSFSDSSNRKKHERTHDKNRERFFCTECSKSYSTKTDLNIHLKVHKGEYPHKCTHPNCSKAFVRLSELYAHERTHDNILPHICQECGKRFREKSRLKKHEEMHQMSKFLMPTSINFVENERSD